RLENIIPACKNIGTTHLTNGAYRLHPIEWNIGESAAHLALFSIRQNVPLRSIYKSDTLIRQLQLNLLADGIGLFWFVDVAMDHPAFESIQSLA
ncbi:FAD-dependent oxidoreductase, partial [Klebsiella pneumoniae]|uniref:FAD-dependent oxidoreductase n=1 Tax=Klebsiella pneumoniae TaxID=573 RepID=UPI003F25D27C